MLNIGLPDLEPTGSKNSNLRLISSSEEEDEEGTLQDEDDVEEERDDEEEEEEEGEEQLEERTFLRWVFGIQVYLGDTSSILQ